MAKSMTRPVCKIQRLRKERPTDDGEDKALKGRGIPDNVHINNFPAGKIWSIVEWRGSFLVWSTWVHPRKPKGAQLLSTDFLPYLAFDPPASFFWKQANAIEICNVTSLGSRRYQCFETNNWGRVGNWTDVRNYQLPALLFYEIRTNIGRRHIIKKRQASLASDWSQLGSMLNLLT
jgi:hypothetical protein